MFSGVYLSLENCTLSLWLVSQTFLVHASLVKILIHLFQRKLFAESFQSFPFPLVVGGVECRYEKHRTETLFCPRKRKRIFFFWERGFGFHLVRWGFPNGSDDKESACNADQGLIPGSRFLNGTPVLLPWEFHRQRSLAGYSPQGHKESDWLTLSLYTVKIFYTCT